MWEIEVKSLKNEIICKISIEGSKTIKSLKEELVQKTGISLNRQLLRRTISDKTPLEDQLKVEECGLENEATIFLKDLGPQVAWKTVFILEYFGALCIYALVTCYYYCRNGNYLNSPHGLALFSWLSHFNKRLYETQNIHRFSHGSMPLKNLFKNCTYYWLFSFLIAHSVANPEYKYPNQNWVIAGFIIFLLCEMGNFSIHVLLRDLRPANSKIRQLPKPNGNIFSKLFDYVCCPNYTYEVGAWIGFTMMTFSYVSAIYTICGFGQMTIWAFQKHRNYMKEFKDYKTKHVIIPFVL